MKLHESPYFNRRKNTIDFYVHHLTPASCHQITVAGSFNHWEEVQMKPQAKEGGCWTVSIPVPPRGKYFYKFFIDGRMWMEDIENPLREPDGSTGWNSVLTVQAD